MFINVKDKVQITGSITFDNLTCKKVDTDKDGNVSSNTEILNGTMGINITVDVNANDQIGGVIGIINALLGKSSFAKKLGLAKK